MFGLVRSGFRGPRHMVSVILGAGAVAAGCGRPAFPHELFTIEAEEAEYPVMLSQIPSTARKASQKARSVQAESGTRAAVYQSSYTAGRVTTTTTLALSSRSELPASTKLQAEIKRRDRWVSIEETSFYARDFSMVGGQEQSRQLTIDATVYR